MKSAELIRKLREDYLDDAVGDQAWSDGDLLRYLAEAEFEACRGSDLLFDDTTASICEIAVSSGTATYAFSSKITSIADAIWDGAPLRQVTVGELVEEYGDEWRTETGVPKYYLIRGRKIRLVPEPTTSDTLYLEVYRLPLNSFTDEPEIPEEHHEDLCSYAAYLCYNRRDEETFDPERGMGYRAEFYSSFGIPDPAEVRAKKLDQPKYTQFLL